MTKVFQYFSFCFKAALPSPVVVYAIILLIVQQLLFQPFSIKNGAYD